MFKNKLYTVHADYMLPLFWLDDVQTQSSYVFGEVSSLLEGLDPHMANTSWNKQDRKYFKILLYKYVTQRHDRH